MSSIWGLALVALVFAIWILGALYAIVEWIYSDMPRGTPRP